MVIGQDPAQHERIVRQNLLAEAGLLDRGWNEVVHHLESWIHHVTIAAAGPEGKNALGSLDYHTNFPRHPKLVQYRVRQSSGAAAAWRNGFDGAHEPGALAQEVFHPNGTIPPITCYIESEGTRMVHSRTPELCR